MPKEEKEPKPLTDRQRVVRTILWGVFSILVIAFIAFFFLMLVLKLF